MSILCDIIKVQINASIRSPDHFVDCPETVKEEPNLDFRRDNLTTFMGAPPASQPDVSEFFVRRIFERETFPSTSSTSILLFLQHESTFPLCFLFFENGQW